MSLENLVNKVKYFNVRSKKQLFTSLIVAASLFASSAFGLYIGKEYKSYKEEQNNAQSIITLTAFKNKDAGWVSEFLYENIKENFPEFLFGHEVKLLLRPTENFLSTFDHSVPMPTYQIFVSGKGLFAVYLTDPVRRPYDFINNSWGKPLPNYMKNGVGKFKNPSIYSGWLVLDMGNPLKVDDAIYDFKKDIQGD